MLVLIHNSGKKVILKDPNVEKINTKYGIIKGPFIPGKIVKSHKGELFLVTEPFLDDIIKSFKKGARPIYQYDAFFFIGLLGLKKGMKILEAGTGSGCVTRCFLELGCKVISYEIREDFYKIAKENLKEYLNDNLTLHNDDVITCNENDFDCIFLDLHKVDEKIDPLIKKLKNGGKIGIFLPNFYNIWNITEKLKENNIKNINIIQVNHMCYEPYTLRLEKFGFPSFFVYGQKVEIKEDEKHDTL